ncbi:MAG: hypothetical protein ACI9W2_004362 [Gammaproteobacteria bacterium]|jgi:hypothetical protein
MSQWFSAQAFDELLGTLAIATRHDCEAALGAYPERALAHGQIPTLVELKQWVRQARNAILVGPSGVDKTHLAAAIGHALTEQEISVRYLSATTLVQQLQLALGARLTRCTEQAGQVRGVSHR